MIKPTLLSDLVVPSALLNEDPQTTEISHAAWETDLIKFFTEHFSIFTPYPNYFRTRGLEFRVLRQLLPEYFRPGTLYERGLEIGCGYGFKTLLLAPFFKKLYGVDMPLGYEGYVRGGYTTAVDIAKLLVNEKFKRSNVSLANAWPHELKPIESNSIDLLFSEYTLEHVPDLTKAADEMYRVVRPNGIMIHVVPNTTDALIQFVKAQLNVSFKTYAKELIKKVIGRGRGRLKLNGVLIPYCHSEFLNDFAKQFDVYSMENYLFPLVERGFIVEKITSTREHNDVLVLRKPQS